MFCMSCVSFLSAIVFPPWPLLCSRPFSLRLLLEDAKEEMGHAGGLYYSDTFQQVGCRAQLIEQPDAATQQYWHQVDLYFVEQPGRDALLHDTRAGHGDVLVPRGCLCLANGAFNAVGDEDE